MASITNKKEINRKNNINDLAVELDTDGILIIQSNYQHTLWASVNMDPKAITVNEANIIIRCLENHKTYHNAYKSILIFLARTYSNDLDNIRSFIQNNESKCAWLDYEQTREFVEYMLRIVKYNVATSLSEEDIQYTIYDLELKKAA